MDGDTQTEMFEEDLEDAILGNMEESGDGEDPPEEDSEDE